MANTTTTTTVVTEYDAEGRVVKTTETTTSELPDFSYPYPPVTTRPAIWEPYPYITCNDGRPMRDAQDRYGYTSRIVA